MAFGGDQKVYNRVQSGRARRAGAFLGAGLALAVMAGLPPAAHAEMVSASLVDSLSPAGAAQDTQKHNEDSLDRRAYRLSWGVRAIGADRLHSLGITGKGVTVAVVDSGLAGASAGLAHSISNASIDIVPGRKDPDHSDRHAVYIAETLVGSPEGEGAVGVAYDAQVLSVRADNDDDCRKECAFSARNLAKAVDYAVSKKVRVIDLSLAGDEPLGARFEASLAKAVKSGAVVVIAAGNDGRSQAEWPGRYAADPRFAGAVVAVGAVNKDGEMASFSNRAGMARASYIAAPGQKVVTDCDAETCALISGTSFAAPHVAGALALLMQAFPDLTGKQALDLILRSAQGGGSLQGDTVYGRGRLDVYRAYQMALSERRDLGSARARP
jgi:subtilisin family serine protease